MVNRQYREFSGDNSAFCLLQFHTLYRMGKGAGNMRHITPQQDGKMRLRTRLLAAVLAVGCLGGLVVRLFVLMLRDPGGYAARAADQQLRGATLPAARGEIYSADGTLLAASETCWTIRAAPREMADDKVEPAARALSEILELDYADTLAKFRQRSSNDCLLRRRVDRAMADAVRDWCCENEVQGVQIRQDTRRVYPQGDFMGGILGFTDVDNAGLWGLELRYNDELTGQNGRILTAKNAWGYDLPTHYQTLVDAVPGNTLTLTIDANIQHWLESALAAAVTEHHVAERGVGIVMDVNTGAVLAMSCQPDYDPNAPRTLIDKDIRDAVNALTGEERSAALQKAQQAICTSRAASSSSSRRRQRWIPARAGQRTISPARARFPSQVRGSAAQTGMSTGHRPLPRGWPSAATPALSRSVRGLEKSASATILRPSACGRPQASTCRARYAAASIIRPTRWGLSSWQAAPSGRAARSAICKC